MDFKTGAAMNIKMESGISTVTSSSQVKSSEQSSTSDNDTNASAYDFLANLLAQMDTIVQGTSQQAGQAETATTVITEQTDSTDSKIELERNPATIQTSLEDQYTFLNEITEKKSTAYLPEQEVTPVARAIDTFLKADTENSLPKGNDNHQPVNEIKAQLVTNIQVADPKKTQQSVAKKVEEPRVVKDNLISEEVQSEEPQPQENTKNNHVDMHEKIEVDLSQAGSLKRNETQASVARLESDFSGSNSNQKQEFVEIVAPGQVSIEDVVTGSAQHAGLSMDLSRMSNMSTSNPTSLQQAVNPVDPGQYRFDVEMPKEVMTGAQGVENQSYIIKMKVYPPNLGRMTTKVTIKDGQASLNIVAESEQSRQIVLHNIQQLRDQFAESNIHLMDVDVSSSNSDERQPEDLQQFAGHEIIDADIQAVEVAKKEKSDNDQLVDTYV